MKIFSGSGQPSRIALYLLLLLCYNLLFVSFDNRGLAEEYDYLNAGECAAIGAGSLALLGLGELARDIDTTKAPIIVSPLPGELAVSRVFGGDYWRGKTNFLDNTQGSALTPLAGAILLTVTNTTWPHDRSVKDAGEDLFAYTSGLIATKGLTAAFKGLTARPRPYMHLDRDLPRLPEDFPEDHASFFSGHASSAFFSAAYLNKRIRSTMRRELSADDYRNYRWISPAVLFGWASFVGWSRIHAYKHYLSDVILGSVAGWLLAELFFSFLDEADSATSKTAGDSPQMLFKLGFSF